MKEPRWLSRLTVDVIHSELLLEYGGSPGGLAGGGELIELELANRRTAMHFNPESDMAKLAAA
jgi:hypothetical protein